ncbi:MAG: DUF456 domain-containing protein [Planctomycetales bacterium]|nr:DUF456 domain-containing protein [Planctomycetales bacterium]
MLDISVAVLFTLLAVVGWIANVLGLPGNWLIVCLALGGWLLAPEPYRSHVSLLSVVAIGLVAIVGEILEFAASAMGASRMGGSKRGTALAIVGSIGGAVFGLFSGALIPVPIIGSLIASLLLGAGGAFMGAVAGERWAGKDWDASLQIGNAAFRGRLLGTVGKAVCGTIACGIFVAAIWM